MVREAESPLAVLLLRVTVLQRTKPLSDSLWTTVRRLPKLSTLWVTFRLLPNASTPVRVMVTESAEAIPTHAKEITSAVVATTVVLMTVALSV
ncbi:hypothetical protein AC629_28575 [Bradyrhizobium sp. NAS80.1]|nr:hypothetical protein AC629_28575 [Bradyrhizobium sp. NAS80.1]